MLIRSLATLGLTLALAAGSAAAQLRTVRHCAVPIRCPTLESPPMHGATSATISAISVVTGATSSAIAGTSAMTDGTSSAIAVRGTRKPGARGRRDIR